MRGILFSPQAYVGLRTRYHQMERSGQRTYSLMKDYGDQRGGRHHKHFHRITSFVSFIQGKMSIAYQMCTANTNNPRPLYPTISQGRKPNDGKHSTVSNPGPPRSFLYSSPALFLYMFFPTSATQALQYSVSPERMKIPD